MPDLFDNPIGLDGFEFVEFCAPEKGVLEPVFEGMGFTLVARHRSKDVQLWRQGDINLIANYEPQQPGRLLRRRARPFGLRHGLPRPRRGQGLCRGARRAAPSRSRCAPGRWSCIIPAIRGIGGSRSSTWSTATRRAHLSIYDIDFVYEAGRRARIRQAPA